MTMKKSSFRILIVDDEEEHRNILEMILSSNGFQTDTAISGFEAIQKISKEKYHLVLSDLKMPEMSGLELLDRIKEIQPEQDVIIVTGYGTVKNAVNAMKRGAFSYFIKGHDPDELLMDIEKIMRLSSLKMKTDALQDSASSDFMMDSKNPKFQEAIRIIESAADSNANILLLGESGVGKEVFASYIHKLSTRHDNPFIAVNCHAFSESLLESELFGHEKGAFTGATDKRIGRFEAAHEGTLFLDEIGDTSLSTQAKLLRSLESRRIERIGSNVSIDVDFRLISATNRDLKTMVAEHGFREDLFYRISTITVELPSLRERREDIPELANFFLRKAQIDMKKEVRGVDDAVWTFLNNYDYPGNIRELKNIIERLVVLARDGWISARDIPSDQKEPVMHQSTSNGQIFSQTVPLREFRKDAESQYIQRVLEQNNYNMTQTSKVLGISRRQLFNKITEYGLKKEE